MDSFIESFLSLAERLVSVEQALPRLEQVAYKTIDALFAPRQIALHIALSSLLHLLVLTWKTSGKSVERLWQRLFSAVGRKRFQIERSMDCCASYQEWLKLANELDVLRGLDKWRAQEDSPLMDAPVLRRRIGDTQRMLSAGDVFDLMFRLRSGLARDQYGTSHEGLYHQASAGTKLIVDEYHAVCSRALNYVCDADCPDVSDDVKLAFFNETRHSYGRTALLLSGGAYLGYYHMGVCKALFLEGLMPRVISGASAGSLMCAVIGTKTDGELADLWHLPEDEADSYRRDYFKPSTHINSALGRQIASMSPPSLHWLSDPLLSLLFDGKLMNLDIQHLQRCVIENVGMWTFQEAFDRTGRIINITVAPMNAYDPPRLLNYLTAPHVCVWSAAVASCAIPGVFDSCVLIVKEPDGNYRAENEWTRSGRGEEEREGGASVSPGQGQGQGQGHGYGQGQGQGGRGVEGGYTDGSIEQDLPMQQLSELFNVNHFIVSQVSKRWPLLAWGNVFFFLYDCVFFLRGVGVDVRCGWGWRGRGRLGGWSVGGSVPNSRAWDMAVLVLATCYLPCIAHTRRSPSPISHLTSHISIQRSSPPTPLHLSPVYPPPHSPYPPHHHHPPTLPPTTHTHTHTTTGEPPLRPPLRPLPARGRLQPLRSWAPAAAGGWIYPLPQGAVQVGWMG